MNAIWGAVLIVFTGILVWLAQTTVVFAPKLAEQLRLIEPESEVDATFLEDARAEVVWDMLSVWTLPVAGVLLLLNNPENAGIPRNHDILSVLYGSAVNLLFHWTEWR